ncbi:hypothetical protein OSH04_07675 [Alcaligenes sp. A-TC2]|uniref:Uncharacterized protein n=1 Tax=Alcaligenes faecalis TaxID=511 RepID=A0AAE9KPB1_ALCFA|nr:MULTISPECIES: hypothetical protein [Alcaligenes]MDH4866761.1 hypothetical protein [Bacillus cereus]MCX5471587.1 hypothetical protein [Alcaligenes nematophilus]MDY7128064.1 hypothetical protein [Alcaligenes nematophilus]OQV31577.1 hypothetical protein BV899_11920 [Alcaligenes phenolicus]UPL20975.1 hypothetical protein MXF72_16505 [Alcaligenes faecalis]
MNTFSISVLTLMASLVVAIAPVQAKGSQSEMDRLNQEYNDAQFCAALLNKLGGDENKKKASLALAEAKNIAPEIGNITADDFNESYRALEGIIKTADQNEMQQFTELCTKRW